MPEPPGSNGYRENAAALAQQYESVTFEGVHRSVMHLFPVSPASVLDVGAGSGRDAAALARRGHRATAVEPTLELRREGQAIHADTGISWLDDALPDLRLIRGTGQRFDLILLTAVWMHLDEDERSRAMASIAALLAPAGMVILSLGHGPVPAGRRMFDVSAQETSALGRLHGLIEVHRSGREDMLVS